MFVSLLKTSEGIYIYANRGGVVTAWETLEKALATYEDSYDSCHSRSYEASMSACINMIQFQPSIIEVEGIEDLRKIASDPPRKVSIGAVSGYYTAVTTRPDVAKLRWEQGKKPRLIRSKKELIEDGVTEEELAR